MKQYKCSKCDFLSDGKSESLRHYRENHASAPAVNGNGHAAGVFEKTRATIQDRAQKSLLAMDIPVLNKNIARLQQLDDLHKQVELLAMPVDTPAAVSSAGTSSPVSTPSGVPQWLADELHRAASRAKAGAAEHREGEIGVKKNRKQSLVQRLDQ